MKDHVDVQVPIQPKTAGGSISTRIVSFEANIDRNDFLDRICAYMGLSRQDANLGYKWNFERRGDHPHRLVTVEDIDEAFERAVKLSSSKRRKKEVVMEVVDLVRRSPGPSFSTW